VDSDNNRSLFDANASPASFIRATAADLSAANAAFNSLMSCSTTEEEEKEFKKRDDEDDNLTTGDDDDCDGPDA